MRKLCAALIRSEAAKAPKRLQLNPVDDCHRQLLKASSILQVEHSPHIARVHLTGRLPALLLIGVSLCLPLVLALHAVYARRELREMRSIFLRDRAASVAARLESMPPEPLQRGDFDDLLEADPALLDIRVFPLSGAAPPDSALDAIRSGAELYHTEEAVLGGLPVLRAYIPFHSQAEVFVARIDLRLDAPDFILVHARHTTLTAIVSGSALIVISLVALWSMRRASRLERRQLETERLVELGRLAATLAHEIRNPLGAIKGFAQLARESAEPATSKPLDAIIRESKRLEALVESLLLYGRPPKPVIVQTSWAIIAGDLEATARSLIGPRDVKFESESNIETIATDPSILKQALLNLVRNAVEAIPANSAGAIRLRAQRERDGGALITLEDSGPGVPPEVRQRLFSAFVTTKASGTGLGLSIAKKLVESLGGNLRIAGAQPHGTKAVVELYGTNPDN
jgi:signal transduction histidine kinase